VGQKLHQKTSNLSVSTNFYWFASAQLEANLTVMSVRVEFCLYVRDFEIKYLGN